MSDDSETIRYHKRLAGTPAELLAIQGMQETAAAGYLLGLHVTPDNEVIAAYDDGLPVALIAFGECEDMAEVWIHFGYCKPEYRRKGHYRACVEMLKTIAKERGYSRVHTAAHPENKNAIESIKARGGKLQYIGFVFPT